VGGTGLYIRALVDGLFDGPGADWKLRDELMEMERERPGSLHASLMAADPAAAARIHPSDIRRTVRALEVYRTGGGPISAMQVSWNGPGGDKPVRMVGLRRPRPELYKRIERRVDEMMEAGLLEEVRALMDMGCTRDMVSMQALGYKQLMAHLYGEYTLETAVGLIKRDTKRYAKRQFTWFNADSRVRWLDLEGGEGVDSIAKLKKYLEIFRDLG
jgi:tRNA dimethylallyltransferase